MVMNWRSTFARVHRTLDAASARFLQAEIDLYQQPASFRPNSLLATIKLIDEADATGEVACVYTDIKRAFGSSAVPNLFKAMGHHPEYAGIDLGPDRREQVRRRAANRARS